MKEIIKGLKKHKKSLEKTLKKLEEKGDRSSMAYQDLKYSIAITEYQIKEYEKLEKQDTLSDSK